MSSAVDSIGQNQFPLPIMLAFSNKTNIRSVSIHPDGISLYLLIEIISVFIGKPQFLRKLQFYCGRHPALGLTFVSCSSAHYGLHESIILHVPTRLGPEYPTNTTNKNDKYKE